MHYPQTARNTDKAHALMYLENFPRDEELCGLADSSNFLQTILWCSEGGEIDFCIWPELTWWAGLDIALRFKKNKHGPV